MKTHRYAAAAFTLLAAAGALAQEGTQDFASPLSTRSRAEVIAEFEQARASGTLPRPGDLYGLVDGTSRASSRTRAEVRAELDAARRDGTLETRNQGPFYGSFERRDVASTKTRAQVRAELEHALASGVRLSQGERSGS